MTSNVYRPNLVATSVRSSKSRITLAENDPKFIANNDLASGDAAPENIIDNPPRTLWIDRVLAMFCAKLSNSTLPIIEKEYVKSERLEGSEVC
jgi:hypothetical protein